MTALDDALAQWAAGQPASVLVVGDLPALEETMHLRLHRRITKASDLRDQLDEMLGGKAEHVLAERRHVVAVENLERLYLRVVGGFEAVRWLQSLIAFTYTTTLWMVSLQPAAFRLLDAAIRLGDGFTHRVGDVDAKPPCIRSWLKPEDVGEIDEVFTLIALLQHGGLTADEHALLFDLPLCVSQRRLDTLTARGLLEATEWPEERRIAESALTSVQAALHRRNLI